MSMTRLTLYSRGPEHMDVPRTGWPHLADRAQALFRIALAAVLLALDSCGGGSSPSSQAPACAPPSTVTAPDAGQASWTSAKAAQAPSNSLPAEYKSPAAQPLANLAWEDGIYISRDGLNLYATYIPMDLLKAVLDAQTPDKFYLYRRGPTLAGQVFPTTIAPPNPWLHSDIAIAQRASTGVPFSGWCLSNMRIATGYDFGAAQGELNSGGSGYDVFVYTRDDAGSGGPKIGALFGVGVNPSPTAFVLPVPLNTSGFEWDNPHVENVGGTLVLFFDSRNLQGVANGKNVFYATSADNGATWTTPAQATTVNDITVTGLGGPAQQPHLYNDGSAWWLYFTAANPADSKLAIYRAQQGTPGNWNSWGAPQLVVSAGTTAGVGEPSLTSKGDLSFVVVTQNPSGTAVDTYDADPWFMEHK